MIGSGMALLRYWPWAVGIAAALALAWAGWTVKGWMDKAARVDAAEIAAKAAQQALEAERLDRARVDLARLAAGQKLSVTIQGYQDRTTILYRNVDRLIPVDRPCLPVEAVVQINALRRGELQKGSEK